MSVHERRPSLKAAGLAVIAAMRMKRMSEVWAGQRRVHAQLVKTLEGMRRRGGRTSGMGASTGAGARQQLSFVR